MRLLDQLHNACCYLVTVMGDNDKISFAYDVVSRAMSHFAKLLWPLFHKTNPL